ncbi:hypothetical protein C1645_881743 [Glomus cerebriforme]|uniref:Uncharacterized protein n=1 Tax=Glomus cerebriforme TaxID=658196 RepID=A0A397S6Q9_9GLOM|nr:hypothetical protein C1645_881743 [Glomus cerebriforme]
MSTNISSIEIVVTGKSAATDNIMRSKNNELILSILKTKSLMKEYGYRKILIDDSSTVKVETINGNRYSIFTDEGKDNNDMNESSFEEFDDDYEYNFNDDYDDDEEEKKTNFKRQPQQCIK